jgi:tetratricopeptide (TPR) repeat protein
MDVVISTRPQTRPLDAQLSRVRTVAARVVIVVLALAGAGWLTVEARSSAAQNTIVGFAFDRHHHPTKADLARARQLAPRAHELNPDVQVDEAIGVLELQTGDRPAAVKTFQSVLKKEPKNAEIWAALAHAARGYDDALAARASSVSRELAPPVPAVR